LLITSHYFILHHFFSNDPPPTDLSTLSLHDALPISTDATPWLPPLYGTCSTLKPAADANAAPARWLTEPMPAEAMRKSPFFKVRSEEHTSELQSQSNLVCRLLLEKKKKRNRPKIEHI